MLMDQMTKRHRGFGFVTFEAEETVEVVCELHYHTIKNKKVEVKKAQPKEAVMSASAASLLGKRLVMLPASSTASSSPASGLVNIPLLQQPLMGLGQIGQHSPLNIFTTHQTVSVYKHPITLCVCRQDPPQLQQCPLSALLSIPDSVKLQPRSGLPAAAPVTAVTAGLSPASAATEPSLQQRGPGL